MVPKDFFGVYDSAFFFFNLKEAPSKNPLFEEIKALLKSNYKNHENRFKNRLEDRLINLMTDIEILIRNDVTHPKYEKAFVRFIEFYNERYCSDSSSPSLWQYYRNLYLTFQVLPDSDVVTRKHKVYTPSRNMERILIQKGFLF